MIDWKLIGKHITGQTSPEENAQVQKWLSASGQNREILSQLTEIYTSGKTSIPNVDLNEIMEEDWQRINQRLQPSQKSNVRSLHFWARVAAAILILFTVSTAIWLTTKNIGSEKYTAIHSSTESLRAVTLDDSTKVWLNRNSVLHVSEGYGKSERKVRLQGEAFFQVRKNADLPFIISSGPINTKVLGTSFNVKAYYEKDSAVIVTVVEGKVNVYTHENSDPGEILTHGHVAVFNPEQGLKHLQNTNLNFQAWRTGVIRFESETLKEVCRYLSTHYKVNIQPQDPSLENLQITTILDRVSANDAAQIIALTLGLQVIEKENTLYFTK